MNVFGHSVSFWKTIFQFLWKNIFDPGYLPNSGSKSSKSISSIFACKIDLKWCIFVTYAKISIYFGQNCWKCSENPHISQIKRKNISRISREIQAKISRETGREFSGVSEVWWMVDRKSDKSLNRMGKWGVLFTEKSYKSMKDINRYSIRCESLYPRSTFLRYGYGRLHIAWLKYNH